MANSELDRASFVEYKKKSFVEYIYHNALKACCIEGIGNLRGVSHPPTPTSTLTLLFSIYSVQIDTNGDVCKYQDPGADNFLECATFAFGYKGLIFVGCILFLLSNIRVWWRS